MAIDHIPPEKKHQWRAGCPALSQKTGGFPDQCAEWRADSAGHADWSTSRRGAKSRDQGCFNDQNFVYPLVNVYVTDGKMIILNG